MSRERRAPTDRKRPAPTLRESLEQLSEARRSGRLDAKWDAWTSQVGVERFPRDFRRLSANAYATFCRTLRGFSAGVSPTTKSALRAQSDQLLRGALDDLVALSPKDERTFDAWHAAACDRLEALWTPTFPLTAGHSQKWVNVLLKYSAALGAAGLFPPLRATVRCFGHAAIDSIVYRALEGASDLRAAGQSVQTWFAQRRLPPWSKITRRADYDALQGTLRELASACGASAADLELFVWQ